MFADLQIITCISNSIQITTFLSTSPTYNVKTQYATSINHKACT